MTHPAPLRPDLSRRPRILASVRHLLVASVTASAVTGALGAPCQLRVMELPVKMDGDRPMTRVTINGTPVPMLIDSGADHSILWHGTATRLGLDVHPLRGQQLTGWTGSVPLYAAQVTHVDKVQVGEAEVPNIDFLVLPAFTSKLGGILGRNFLAAGDTEYDLAHGMVRLVFPQGNCEDTNFAYWAKGSAVNVVPLKRSVFSDAPNAIRVPVTLNGHAATAFLDTGAMATRLTLPAARQAGIRTEDMTPQGRTAGLSFQLVDSWIAPLATFELGAEKVSGSQVEVDDTAFDDDLLIGVDYFLSHRIYVAQSQGKLYATYEGGRVFAANHHVAAPAAGASAPQDDPRSATAARRASLALTHRAADVALVEIERALATQPDKAAWRLIRVEALLAARRPDEAKVALDDLLRIAPRDAGARMARARLRHAANDDAAALEDLLVADQALAPDADERYVLAELYGDVDHRREEIAQWTAWLDAHPGHTETGRALNGRCWSRVVLGQDLEAAVVDGQRAIALEPGNASYLDSLAWALLRLGRDGEAKDAFDRALKRRHNAVYSLLGRSVAERRLGDTRAADWDLGAAKRVNADIVTQAEKAGLPVR